MHKPVAIYERNISLGLWALALFAIGALSIKFYDAAERRQLKNEGELKKAHLTALKTKKISGIKNGLSYVRYETWVEYEYVVNSLKFSFYEKGDNEYYQVPLDADSIWVSYLPTAPNVHRLGNIANYQVASGWDILSFALLGLLIVPAIAYEIKLRNEQKLFRQMDIAAQAQKAKKKKKHKH